MIIQKKIKYDSNVWSKKQEIKLVTLNDEKKKFNINHRREKHFYKGFKVLDSKFNEILDVRFYSTDGASTCCVWLDDVKTHLYTRGSGRADGLGYNRESAAFEEALENCGFDYIPRFGGSGVNEFGVNFVMKFLGVKNFHIVEIVG